jgi:hypothetical protein
MRRFTMAGPFACSCAKFLGPLGKQIAYTSSGCFSIPFLYYLAQLDSRVTPRQMAAVLLIEAIKNNGSSISGAIDGKSCGKV